MVTLSTCTQLPCFEKVKSPYGSFKVLNLEVYLKVIGFRLDRCSTDRCMSHSFLREPSNRLEPLGISASVFVSFSLHQLEQLIMPEE
jgi:hypothetical protein